MYLPVNLVDNSPLNKYEFEPAIKMEYPPSVLYPLITSSKESTF